MKYSHEEIQKMLEPLFEYMKTEHPNNCKLVIEPFSAQLIYEHQEQIWLSKEFELVSTKMANSPKAQKLKEILFTNSEITKEDIKDCCSGELPDWAKDCCCDIEAAEQQRKDLETLTYDEYMMKWAKNVNVYSITTSDSKDCTMTTIT